MPAKRDRVAGLPRHGDGASYSRRVGECRVLVLELVGGRHRSPFRLRLGPNGIASLSTGRPARMAALVASGWIPDAERGNPAAMDLRRQAWIRRVIRRVGSGQQPCPRACEAAGRVQDVKPPRRIAKTKPSCGDPMTTYHRRVTEVSVLAQTRVPESEVVEGDSEPDVAPYGDAISIASATQARRLAKGAYRSVQSPVPLN
jgi:hypothetical protein